MSRAASGPGSGKPRSVLIGWLLTLGCFLVGVFCLWFGGRWVLTAMDSKGWPQAEGVVLSSAVKRERSQGSDGKMRNMYRAAVSYRYTVDGRQFVGSRVSAADGASSAPSSAGDVVRRYPKDRSMMVFYNPADPADSLLEPGVTSMSWLVPGIGIGFVLFSVILAVNVGIESRKKGQVEGPLGGDHHDPLGGMR